MQSIFLIYFFIRCSFAQVQYLFRDDYSYEQESNGWVKLHSIPAKWHDARLRCEAEGASLASPSTPSLVGTMVAVMISKSNDPHIGVYSGIHSTFSNGTYTTLEGVPLKNVPVNWVLGQPDNVYTENCVIFHMNATLEDVDCYKVYQYICYKKFEPLTMNKCNTVDNGYKWAGRTGHCYKFHRHGKTWAQAYMTCAAEGGYLAIINSDDEAAVLKELFAKYPRDKIFTRDNLKDSAVIGFREWPAERSWYTVHGQTLEVAGYERWSPGQPDNAFLEGDGENCGAIWRTGLLDDVWCNQNTAFICEKEP